jgi:hypothetical protein
MARATQQLEIFQEGGINHTFETPDRSDMVDLVNKGRRF